MPPAPTTSTPSPTLAASGPPGPTSSPEDDQREKLTDEPAAVGELTFDEAIALFNDAKKYVDTGYRTDWDRYFKVYSGHRVIRNYEGISDPVIRESHTIIETLVANIASGYPKFHFVQTNSSHYPNSTSTSGSPAEKPNTPASTTATHTATGKAAQNAK